MLADPHSSDPELRAHRDACARVHALYRSGCCVSSRGSNARVRGRDSGAWRMCCRSRVRPRGARAAVRGGWLAIAASVLLGAGRRGGLWLVAAGSQPRRRRRGAHGGRAGSLAAHRRPGADAGAATACSRDSKLRLNAGRGHRQLRQQLRVPRTPGAASRGADRRRDR